MEVSFINRDTVRQMVQLGESLNQDDFYDRVLDKFESQCSELLATISQAIGEGSGKSETICSAAHKLKGGASSVGASGLARACEDLQRKAASQEITDEELSGIVSSMRQQSHQSADVLRDLVAH